MRYFIQDNAVGSFKYFPELNNYLHIFYRSLNSIYISIPFISVIRVQAPRDDSLVESVKNIFIFLFEIVFSFVIKIR